LVGKAEVDLLPSPYVSINDLLNKPIEIEKLITQ